MNLNLRKLHTTAVISGHLVELEGVEEVKKFPVLFAVLQFDVVLLESMQRQLCVIVHVHLHWL